MKRNRRLSNQSDPLELMLDTLSNVFGGIILISCLLALIPRNQSRVSISIESQAHGEMIERRLSAAKEQLAEADTAIKTLTDQEDMGQGGLNLKRNKLEVLVGKLRGESRVIEDSEISNAELEAMAKLGDPEVLGKELERLRRIAAEKEGMSKTIVDKIKFLSDRLDSLVKELEALEGGITQQLRFPRERGGKKNPFPVIVWGGRLYPLATGANLSSNPAVAREAIPGRDSIVAKPIRGKGCENPLDDRGFMAGIKAAKKKGGYISIYLYPDSHGIFRELKAALFEEGIGYGIEFVPASQVLVFGSDGTKPPEL
jgi:hypothetical protein